jgi:hypothetical protein
VLDLSYEEADAALFGPLRHGRQRAGGDDFIIASVIRQAVFYSRRQMRRALLFAPSSGYDGVAKAADVAQVKMTAAVTPPIKNDGFLISVLLPMATSSCEIPP